MTILYSSQKCTLHISMRIRPVVRDEVSFGTFVNPVPLSLAFSSAVNRRPTGGVNGMSNQKQAEWVTE